MPTSPVLAPCLLICLAALGSCGAVQGEPIPPPQSPAPQSPAPHSEPPLDEAQKRVLAIELDLALRTGDFGAAQEIVDRGADLDLQDDFGNRLANAACRRDLFGDGLRVLDFLRNNGADLNAPSEEGYPPVADAVWWGRVDLLPYFKKHGATLDLELPGPAGTRNKKYTLLHVAAFQGRAECLEWLLGEGLPIEARTISGQTPLSMAAARGYPDCVAVLLASGADAAAEDEEGRTPLDLARAEVQRWKNDPSNRTGYDEVVKRFDRQ